MTSTRLLIWWGWIALGGCVGRSDRPTPLPGDESYRSGDERTGDPGLCNGLTGLIAHWPMNAEDVNGAVLLDRSGNDHDGTLTGAPPPIVGEGWMGDGLEYPASSVGYVAIPTLPLPAADGEKTTVSLWYRHEGPAVDDVLLYLPPGPGASPPRYDLWLTNRGGAPLALCINGGMGECWGIEDPGLLGRWVHVVVVFVNGPTTGGSLYIDGALATASCVFGTCNETRTTQNPVTLGGSDTTYAFHGGLDDVRIFDRELSSTEVQQLTDCAE